MSELVIWVAVSVVAGMAIFALGVAVGVRLGHRWTKNPPPDDPRERKRYAC